MVEATPLSCLALPWLWLYDLDLLDWLPLASTDFRFFDESLSMPKFKDERWSLAHIRTTGDLMVTE